MRKLTLLLALLALGPGCSGGSNIGHFTGRQGKAELFYRQGRAEWNKRTGEGLRASLRLFQAAAQADPGMAKAHAGVADAAALLALYGHEPAREMLPMALERARVALDADPTLASAHASLGLALYLYERDFQGAQESFHKALELDPAYLPARQWLAMLLIALGDYPQAISHFEQTLQYQPGSLLSLIKLGSANAALGDYAQAQAHFEEAGQIAPQSSLLQRETVLMLLRQGRLPEALERASRLCDSAPDDPANLAVLGHLQARTGQTAQALQITARLDGPSRGAYQSPTDLAQVLAGLGRWDEAFLKLDEALAENDPSIVYLNFKPTYDPLRGDPRFASLLSRIGLPAANPSLPQQ